MRLPLKLVWKLAIAPGRKGLLSSRPEASGEYVFVSANEDVLDSSGGHEHVWCVNGRTGSEVWKVPAERFDIAWSTETCPSVVANTLLVRNEQWTMARGLSVESGRVLYTLNARKLRLWRNRWLLMGKDDLVVADSATGAILDRRAPLPIPSSSAGLVRIQGDVMLYEAEENTQVVAYDLARQSVLWSRPLKREIAERCGCEVNVVTLRPLDPNTFLAHVTSSVVVGGSLADGSILWDMTVQLEAPVVPHGDRVYVMQHVFRESPRLISLDAATGARVYDVVQHELHGMDITDYGRIHEDHIAFGTRSGLVGLFRLSDGHLAWSYRHTARGHSNVWLHAPAIAGDRLYACAGDGHLLIFEAA